MPAEALRTEAETAATVLIIDDDATNVAVLQGVLMSAGYRTVIANSGREALDRVADDTPDLILLDITMPESDGLEVCRRIKTSPAWRDIPVIIITALDEVEDYARALDCGADDFMTTPFTFAVLLARVRGYLRAKRATEALRAAKGAAEAANLAKSQFLANMSHELRTPLNAILGYSEMLQEEAHDRGYVDFLPDLCKIHAAGKHLLNLINDILDLSKIEAGKMALCLEAFDVANVVGDALSTVEPLVTKNANTLKTHIAHNVGTMYSDLTKVQQSLLNLLSNACKFTEHGTIAVDVTRDTAADTDWLCFQVRDTGIGIAPGQIPRLFQAFSQADTSSTRKYGGTGLGLAITQRFCQMLGGDITVDSTPGQGSTFIMRLPAEVRPVAESGDVSFVHKPVSAQTITGSPSASAPTVLVIDDDSATRALLARVLSKEGLQVVTAANGQEGLRLAQAVHPVAITLDVLMSDMDGWSVLNALKTDPELATIPVVMLTITDDQHRGFTLGAADFLTKPIDSSRLLNVLQQHQGKQNAPLALIVEDDTTLRELLRQQLHKAGWTAREAENGRVALASLSECRPAVILLDLMMPEMDGFTFLREIRRTDAWRKIPVIVLSAKDITPAERVQLNGAVAAVLQKGTDTGEELLHEIRQLVRTRANAVSG
jgi:CheY-like chemotaxis protein/nitrogen-specific signal transduction histidine kinase